MQLRSECPIHLLTYCTLSRAVALLPLPRSLSSTAYDKFDTFDEMWTDEVRPADAKEEIGRSPGEARLLSILIVKEYRGLFRVI